MDIGINQHPLVGNLKEFQPLSYVLVNGTENEEI